MESNVNKLILLGLLVSPFILAVLLGLFGGTYFILVFYLIVLIIVCGYYVYTFIKGDVRKKRTILQTLDLDFSKMKYIELRSNEIRENVISFLINSIEVSSWNSRMYVEWGQRWQIDHWHLVDGMRIYLEELDRREPSRQALIYTKEPEWEELVNARSISIIYKNNVPSIKYDDKRDQRYYQYDIYRAFAKEIVDRHFISRQLETIFENPIPKHYDLTPYWKRRMNGTYYGKPSESERKAQEDEWKEKCNLYREFWENPLDFSYEGNWLDDKDFSRTFATKLWEKYCEPFPVGYFDEW
jgi:hypothetical protein